MSTANASSANHSSIAAPAALPGLTEAQALGLQELLRVSPVADEIARRFESAGFRLALVGGSVRDALLGRLGNDLDFTTDARPQQVLKLVKGWADAVWDVASPSAPSAPARTPPTAPS